MDIFHIYCKSYSPGRPWFLYLMRNPNLVYVTIWELILLCLLPVGRLHEISRKKKKKTEQKIYIETIKRKAKILVIQNLF